MEKDVISEADDTIVIDVPEQKEYVISIANNSYKIKPIFSIYVYEQLIEDINELSTTKLYYETELCLWVLSSNPST